MDVDDGVTNFDVQGSDVYLLTHKGAPRFKLIRIRADAPDLGKAEVVVPQGRGVLTRVTAAKDALYLRELERGLGRIRRIPFGGRSAASVPLPSDGAIQTIVTDRRRPGYFPARILDRLAVMVSVLAGPVAAE